MKQWGGTTLPTAPLNAGTPGAQQRRVSRSGLGGEGLAAVLPRVQGTHSPRVSLGGQASSPVGSRSLTREQSLSMSGRQGPPSRLGTRRGALLSDEALSGGECGREGVVWWVSMNRVGWQALGASSHPSPALLPCPGLSPESSRPESAGSHLAQAVLPQSDQ
jgi:hypothetical protein